MLFAQCLMNIRKVIKYFNMTTFFVLNCLKQKLFGFLEFFLFKINPSQTIQISGIIPVVIRF